MRTEHGSLASRRRCVQWARTLPLPSFPASAVARIRLLVAASALALLPLAEAGAGERASAAATALVGSSVHTAAHLESSVRRLCDPAWGGRAPASAGADSAAAWIATRFRSAGLVPAGRGDSWFVDLPVATGVRVEGVIGLRDERRGYGFGRDYWPQGFSRDGRVLSTLVFAGYGITASGQGYDDYAGIDASGRIVVVLGGAPGGAGDGSLVPRFGPDYASPFAKARNAARHGASAILLVTPSGGPIDRTLPWAVPQDRGFLDAGILAAHLTGTSGDSLLASCGVSLRERQAEIDRALRPSPAVCAGDSAEIIVSLRRLAGVARSVAGVLPGKSQETVVVVAPFDGYGTVPAGPGPVVCPGASDPATATAVLLALADAMRGAPPLDRSLGFVAYAGRDFDGAGFDSVLAAGGIDRESVVAVIELRALGRLREDRLFVTGGGDAARGLARAVNDLLPAKLQLDLDGRAADGSIAARAAGAGTFAVTVSGGSDPADGTPADTIDALDLAATARACRFVHGLVRATADPQFFVPESAGDVRGPDR